MKINKGLNISICFRFTTRPISEIFSIVNNVKSGTVIPPRADRAEIEIPEDRSRIKHCTINISRQKMQVKRRV